MKILFCYPWLKLGGAPLDAITLAKGLKDMGHDLYFFTNMAGMYEEQLKETGVHIISAPYSKFNPNLYHLNYKAYRLLCNTIDRYDTDVIHCFHFNSYYLSLFATLSKNVPVVFSLVWFANNVYHPSYPGRIIFVAEEFLHQSKPYFRSEPREKYVIPNRVDLDVFHPGGGAGDFPRKYKLPDSDYKIAFMSRVNNGKIGSLMYALDAVKILASRQIDVCLAIAGDGPLFDKLKQKAKYVNEATGKETVKILGPINDTPQFLAWADVVFGIGRCAWEGMACEKPTLVVGENGLAGIVNPSNAEELGYYNFAGRNVKYKVSAEKLADAVTSIMSDRDAYKKLASFARKYVEDNLDYKKGVVRFEEIYKEALQDPPLSIIQKWNLFWSNLVFGYGYQGYLGVRMIVKKILIKK
jgi:glycosyltransferase involved in cell wall biosynthesis